MSFKVREAHWQILLEAMEANSVIATGKFIGPKGRELYKKLWEETATKLNSLGFGSKTTEKWQKTWTDFKYNFKKKAANVKKSMFKTGGGTPEESDLSELELKILDILGEHFIGLNEPECGLPIQHTTFTEEVEEPQPSTSKQGSDSELAGPSSASTPEVTGKKRKLNIQQPVSSKKQGVEYLPEYRDTLNELREIKTNIRESLTEINTTVRESLQVISQDLKEMTTEIRLLNNNLVQILQQQQTFVENIYNV